ncbi:MAG: type II secretion protein F [Propionibacterium sp.]|nr:type II secretion protein F [Propionibacterium sp.]
MITPAPVIAGLALGVALLCLVPGPNRSALRQVAASGTGQSAAAWRGRMPGWLSRISGLQWRFGLLAGAVCWLVLGQDLGAGLAGAGAIPLAIAGLRWLEAASQRRKAQQLAAQLPGCLELFAAALDAGVPLRAAVRHVAALAPEPSAGLLRAVLGHLDLGRSDAQAWAWLRDDTVWGAVARDLARCAESGAAVAEVLEVHAAEARALRRARREMAARTVGVRSVLPLVCCFLPAFILVGVVPIIAATLGSFTQLR